MRSMNILDWLTGCIHPKTCFPQTRLKRQNLSGLERPAGTYVQCLSCGAELPYSWEEMKIITGQRKVKTREQEA